MSALRSGNPGHAFVQCSLLAMCDVEEQLFARFW